MRKLLLILAVAPCLAHAAKSIVLTNATGTYTVPNAPPFQGLGSYWIDLRVHSYSIPAGFCTNLIQIPGTTQVRLCDPAISGGGILPTYPNIQTAGGSPNETNPPGLQIIGASQSNPMVLSLGAPPPANVIAVGSVITVWGVTDSSCSGLNGNHTIQAVSGLSVTIGFDGSGCTYSSGALVYGQDVLLRFQVDVPTNTISGETWNVDGTGHTVFTQNVNAFNPVVLPGSFQIGPAPVSLAYVRLCQGTTPLNGTPPTSSLVAPCGGAPVLADWEFEGNLADSGPNHLAISFNNASYVTTPLYAPSCNPGPQQSLRVGTAASIDGSRSFPLDGGSTLQTEWQLIPSTEPGVNAQTIHWTSSQLGATPTFDSFSAGPLNFQLSVTDGTGQSTTCVVHDGAVATDDAGNVELPDPRLGQILGPITQWGNPNARWPFIDTVEKTWADRLGGFQGLVVPGGLVTDFVDAWNTAQAGTVDCVNGQTTCTGHGTSFQDVFCGGPGSTTPVTSLHFIGWYNYTLANGGGGTGRRYYNVASCPSETSLVLSSPWGPPTQTGMNFAVWPDSGLGSWLNGSANINYYDNVMAFYAMYYRTGIDNYLHYARWLADRWWTMPLIDRGNANDCESTPGNCANFTTFPRLFALSGMYMRAIDEDMTAGVSNSSSKWAGIRMMTDGMFRFPLNISGRIGDLRENAYQDMVVAFCAAYDPDPVHAASCRTDVASLIDNVWTPARFPDGSWKSFAGNVTNVYTVWGDTQYIVQGLTMNVQPNSSVVTVSGGALDPSWFPSGTVIMTFGDFNTPSSIDSQTYQATYVDSTHLSITPPYAGTCGSGSNPCSGRSFVTGNTGGWLGFGTQPFMLGIAGHWFNQAYIALSLDPTYANEAALAQNYMVQAANWISKSTLDGSGGTDPVTRGALYGVGFEICTPGTEANACRTDIVPSRENMGEALGALAIAYSYAPTPSLLAAVDNVFSANYAKFAADPGYDGTYADDLDGYFVGTNNPKWFGFFWGMGRNTDYLSARQGGLAAPVYVTVQVSPDLSRVPGAVSFRVALTDPSGRIFPPVTCAAAPCPVRINKTLGAWTMQISYLSASGSVISTGKPFQSRVQ